MTDLVSFIIVNRNGKNLNDAIDNIKTVYEDVNKEIIIIEQADNLPFMRGQLFNVGVKLAKGKYIALSDNDMFHFRKVPWIDIYETYKKPLIGFKYISQVTLINHKPKITETSICPTGFGGFNFMKRDDFIAFNGFSNLFVGWGFEDNAYATRFEYVRIPQNLGHITHPRRLNNDPKNKKLNLDYYHTETQRDKFKDGYAQTLFNVLDDKVINDVRYIKVNNITVPKDFAYMNLLEKHFK